jgi:predicted TIM-barrel fold metal-dependent hydrolase
MDLIDAHLHLIHRDQLTYNWLPQVPLLDTGDFTLADMKALAAGRITGSIFMEVDVTDFRAEAQMVHGLMQPGAGLLGQIASCRPETAQGFDEWLAECDALNVVGFRRILHEGPDHISQSDTFRRNVRAIGATGRVFDMVFLARQLPVALELARACPDMTLVLDHCGVPDIAGGAMDPWRADMAALAALPHVNCKLSGILAYCAPGNASLEVVRPWVEHVIEVFGPDRVLWGSDWPVVNRGGGLPLWLDITDGLLAGLSVGEQAAIRAGTARRVYKV